MNFYRLNAELTAVLRTIEDGGELTDDVLAAVQAIEASNPDCIDNLCRLIRETTVAAIASRGESAWFTNRARQQENATGRFKQLLLQRMLLLGLQGTSTPLFSVDVRKGPPKLVVPDGFDPVLLVDGWDRFIRAKYELDSEEMKRAIKANDPVPPRFSLVQDDYVKISPR